MGIKLIAWDDTKTKIEVQKRLKNSSDSRLSLEDRWIRNERTIYAVSSTLNMNYLQTSLENNFNIGLPGVDGSDAETNAAYTFKNFRFIHAQMSANPPVVAMRPISSDQEDHRRADAADRIVRWALRHYSLQEKMDMSNLNTLLYGTGFVKTVWDSTKGGIIEYDDESGEVKLEGDISVTIPFVWNMFLDPDAKCWEEVKFVMERIFVDHEEAIVRWPDKKDLLSRAKMEPKEPVNRGRESQLQDFHYNSVELLEYWETGLPSNGYLGRYCITDMDGNVLEPVRPSPFRFRQAGAVSRIEALDIPDDVKEAKIAALPEQARLPYHSMTDIDVANNVWGRSAVEYAAQLQANLNKLDSARLDNIQAHGNARMIIPDSCEVSEDAITNSPWDVIKITGNQPPYHMQAPTLMPEMSSERQVFITGINDVMGVNEAMFGQQSRQQSGASMQYATNQGNMIRRRLFNKYVLLVESVHKAILSLVCKHWSVSRTIHVLGKEKALEAVDIKGADIDGGYDVVGEYGVTLSLDPVTRREEIMTLMPTFEKAGVPMRTALKMMKLNELEGMYDKLDLSENRQREIFEMMISTGRYIPPKKYRDHENMIAWALDYFMTQEFESLPDDLQALCERHIEERGALAAQEKAGPTAAAGAPPAGGGMAPPPGAPPMPVAGPGEPQPGPMPTLAQNPPPPTGAPAPSPGGQ